MAANSNIAPRAGQAASRWGHWGPTWLILSVGAIIAIGLHPLEAGTPASVLVPIAVLGFAVVSWLAMRQHDRRLCEVCAMAMPLNTSEVAARHHYRFAVAHVGSDRPLVLTYVMVLVGSNFVLLHGNLVERISWALIQSTMVYLVLAYSSHRRFQPWCPQCQGGDGNDDRIDHRGPAPSGTHLR